MSEADTNDHRLGGVCRKGLIIKYKLLVICASTRYMDANPKSNT
jgi:hypothetical protein